MKNLVAALALALIAQTASAQLAAEGLVIGLKRNDVMPYISKLAPGGVRLVCNPEGDSRLKEKCISSAVTGLFIEGHPVEQLRVEFFVKRSTLLEVTFADRELEAARASLIARMTEKLGEPCSDVADTTVCEWKRDGQVLLVGIMDSSDLVLAMLDLEHKDEFWREMDEFDDFYPFPGPRTKSLRRDFSMR